MVRREWREKQRERKREREWQLWRGEGTTPTVKEREEKEEIGKGSVLHRTNRRTDPATTTVREKTSTHFTLDERSAHSLSSSSFFLQGAVSNLLKGKWYSFCGILVVPPSMPPILRLSMTIRHDDTQECFRGRRVFFRVCWMRAFARCVFVSGDRKWAKREP